MVLTKNTQFPSDEELTVQEINVSWPLLLAASAYIGKKCEWPNNVSFSSSALFSLGFS